MMNASPLGLHVNTTLAQSWRQERFKIGFQYALVLVSSVIVGWLFGNSSDTPVAQEQLARILGHFFPSDTSLPSFGPMLSSALSLSSSALICASLVFLFSFSVLNGLINNGIVLYLGVRTGYSSAVLFWATTHTDQIGYGRCLLFFVLKGSLLILMLIYAYRASEYSCYFRIYSTSGRALLPTKTVLSLCVHTLWVSSLVIGLHALYVWLLYMIS